MSLLRPRIKNKGATVKLDYSIKDLDKRKTVVDEVLNQNRESIDAYFNQVHLSSKDKIPYNHTLHTLANYILYCDKMYNYTSRKQFEFEKQTLPLLNEEYKIKQQNVITKDDIEKVPYLKDIEKSISKLKPKTANRKFSRWVHDLKYTQNEIKNSYLKPIGNAQMYNVPSYQNNFDLFVGENINNPLNLDLFDPENWKIVLKILSYEQIISDKVDRLIKIFNKIYPICKFSDIQNKIINIYRDKNAKNKELSSKLGVKPSKITKTIDEICLIMSNEFIKYFEDNVYYVFLARGKYKKCPVCGKNKIIQKFDNDRNMCRDCYGTRKICPKCGKPRFLDEFGKHPNTKDGRQSWCRFCDSERKF
jgi:hypothetical protein